MPRPGGRATPATGSHRALRGVGERFANVRLQIAYDERQTAADRMRAMEQLENRALGTATQRTELETKQKRLEDMGPSEIRDLLGLDEDED